MTEEAGASGRRTIIERIVRDACYAPSNPFGAGCWSHHIVPVTQFGAALARRLDANAEVVDLAALLHDYAGVKDAALYADHEAHSAQEAERVLAVLEYPSETIEAVKACILTHRASQRHERRSPEAICLASADGMAHIAEWPSLLYLAFRQRGMEIDEGTLWVREKLMRSWAKICPEGREMIGVRYEAALLFSAPNERDDERDDERE